MGWKIFDLEMDPAISSSLPRDNKIVKSMEKVDSLFTGSDILIIAVESESLFTGKTLQKLSTFQDTLESLGVISRVTSIFNQNYILPNENGFEIEPLLIEIPSDTSAMKNLISRIKDSGVLGNLVSDDLTILCFICQINSSFEYDEFRFRKDVFSLVNNYRGPEYFFVSSLPITRATIIEYMQRDMRVFTPVAVGLCIFLLCCHFVLGSIYLFLL